MNEGNNVEMPKYKCHKEVHALKIAAIEYDAEQSDAESWEIAGSAVITPAEKGFAAFKVDQEYLRRHRPEVGGYYVLYVDGYKSYSSAKAFEEGYTTMRFQ